MRNLFRRLRATAARPSRSQPFTPTEKKYLWQAALFAIQALKTENELLRRQLDEIKPARRSDGRFKRK